MDFLLDPNIAYLFLLGSVLLVMLSLATPGTGFFEIGAFFCIVLAGYAVYNLSFNWWALVILVLSIVPFVYAIQKPKRELFLGLSIMLIVLGSVFLFARTEEQPSVSPFLAVVGSGLTAGFLWIAVRKTIEAASVRPSHDLEGLVGQIGEARTDVHEEEAYRLAQSCGQLEVKKRSQQEVQFVLSDVRDFPSSSKKMANSIRLYKGDSYA